MALNVNATSDSVSRNHGVPMTQEQHPAATAGDTQGVYPPDSAQSPSTPSCLRRMSAYSGGYVDMSMRRRGSKRLTFADQHGKHLVSEREFYKNEPPNQTCCCGDMTADSSFNSTAAADLAAPHRVKTVTRCPRHSVAISARWQPWDSLSPHELLSMCVLSCSFVGCVLIGYRHFIK